MLLKVFEKEGITVMNGRLRQVRKGIAGIGMKQTNHVAVIEQMALEGTTNSEITEATGDLLLVAVGRTPNVQGLGLETLGIKLNDRGGIDVNKRLETSVKGVYAAGDCTGDRQL